MTRYVKLSVVLVVFLFAWDIEAGLVDDLVRVENPGNDGEWSGESYGGQGADVFVGDVDYCFQIGAYEITAGQYVEFLNAAAKSDPPRTLQPIHVGRSLVRCWLRDRADRPARKLRVQYRCRPRESSSQLRFMG